MALLFTNSFDVREIRAEIKELRERYWALNSRHDQLLNYLGVYETEQPARTIFKKNPSGPTATQEIT